MLLFVQNYSNTFFPGVIEKFLIRFFPLQFCVCDEERLKFTRIIIYCVTSTIGTAMGLVCKYYYGTTNERYSWFLKYIKAVQTYGGAA
jgi:hypothetical protein